MGRILEALKKAEADHRTPAEETSSPCTCQTDPASEPTVPVEIPFIEVGGPGMMVEASPSVLGAAPASPGKGRIRRPSPGKSALPAPAAVQPGRAVELGPLSLSFRPLHSAPVFPASARERFGPELVAFHHPDASLAEQYRSLGTAITRQLPEGLPQVVLFSAPAEGPSKTTVVLNLAITWARDGQRVVVVDAGASPPALAQRLGLAAAPGLGDVVQGTVALAPALRESGQPNLQALTAGSAVPALVSGGETVKGLLRQLRRSFDRVLIDGRPWDGVQGGSLGSACDMVYLVLPQAEVQTPGVEELLQAVPRQGGRLGGLILTCP